MERGDVAKEQDARALAERTNKLRANFYNFYTDKVSTEKALAHTQPMMASAMIENSCFIQIVV